MRIAHIADVHIRGFSRHAETRKVFQQFAREVKEQAVDLIFVGGDIFHTKTSGITPEYIDLMRWWLTELAEAAPVHLILGNHDGNLTNASRQDAISPIVETLNNPRVFLYKKSGVYPFAPGWNWCVFSLFDEEGWRDVKPIAGDINIAAFHGSVRTSVTETGWLIEDGVKVDFFNDYEFALLGDIHMHQFLGWRDEEKKKPWIGYPSSPIAQNYSEGEHPHGYLIWDIKTPQDFSVEFKELPQPHPFVTIDWNGNFDDFKRAADRAPNCARFRVRNAIHFSQNDISRVNDYLKRQKEAIEVVLKSEQAAPRDVFSAGGLEMMREDLRNVEVQMLLLKDFYSSVDVTEEQWDKIKIYLSRYLKALDTPDDVTRHTKWSIDSLAFDNLYCYGAGNAINFRDMKGVVGLFGHNRHGKSSVLGSLMYCLFNGSDRGSIKNIDIVNSRKACGSATAGVIVDGKKFSVTRETSKTETKRGDIVAPTTLDLYELSESGEKSLLNGESRTDTEKSIRKRIGSQEDFMLTTLSTQDDLKKFVSEGSAFRKLILTRFLDLDVFDKMHDLAKRDLAEIAAGLKGLPARDWIEETDRFQKKIAGYDDALSKIENKIEKTRDRLKDLHSRLALFESQTKQTTSEEELEESKIIVSNLERRISTCESSITRLSDEIDVLDSHSVDLKFQLTGFQLASLKISCELEDVLCVEISKLEREYEREHAKLEQISKSVRRLSVVPCGDSFPTCMFIKDSHEDKKREPSQTKITEEFASKLLEKKECLRDVKKLEARKQLKAYDDLRSAYDNTNHKIEVKSAELSSLKANLEHYEAQLRIARVKLSSIEQMFSEETSRKLHEMRSEIESVEAEVKKLDGMRIQATTAKAKLESELFRAQYDEKQFMAKTSEFAVFELITNAISKRGIPTKIINSQLPAINVVIREILNGVVDFTVEFEADQKSDFLEIYINYGDSRRIIELGSGMEKMFAALAIRVALWTVTSLPKTDMFVIDEGFGALDEVQVEACNRLLTALKRYFRIVIVITHVDAVKDIADTIVEVTHREKDAFVNVK